MKRAIVTGGCRGIGAGITEALLKDGWSVVTVGSSPAERYADVMGSFSALGEAAYVQCNIGNVEDIKKCVENAVEILGGIDLLVNDAGVAPLVRTDLLEMTPESFDRVVGINTRGTMFFSQYAAKHMISQESEETIRGMIVNISSISAEVSSISRGEYCVSKAGISMLTKLYADRLASEGIYVYEIRPGIIKTDMTATVAAKYDDLFEQGICPIKRWGYPEDIGKAVAAISSGAFPYSTGQVINVDGGFHITRL